MAFTEEQIDEVKRQIFAQTTNLSPDRKKQIEEQIDSMSPEELETFVQQQMDSSSKSQKPVFRAIVDGEIPAKKIDENPQAIAVIDIKPISKAHIVIIPKSPVKDAKALPKQIFSLAKKISKRISSKFKSRSSEIQTELKFGEIVINVIPIYDKPLSLNSPRYDAQEKELDEVYQKLKAKKSLPRIRISTKPKKSSKVIKLNRRIP